MSSIFYNDGFEVTPDLKRFKKRFLYFVFPIYAILICLWGTLFRWYCYEYLDMKDPLWGVRNLTTVFYFSFLVISVFLMIPLLGGPLLTWFKVRRSNLLHAIVDSLNQGKGLDSSYCDSTKKDRDHFYRADDEKLEFRMRVKWLFILLVLLVTSFPLICFLIHVFTNDVSDIDIYFLLPSIAGILTIFYNLCLMKSCISFNRTKGTLTYFGFLLPWHRSINFDKVQINAYANTFKMMIPYRLIGLWPIGEYKEAQAWWSYYMWYMDRNRPLPPGSLFSQEIREQDYLRRKAAGFPVPLYQSSIDTPEWEGAVTKYQDTEAEQRNQTIYKGSPELERMYLDRKAYLKAHTYVDNFL